MRRTIKVDSRGKVVIVLLVILSLWWIWLQFLPQDNFRNQLYSATYGIMALFGGIFGLSVSKSWGFTRSVVGKAALMFSLGLLAQEFGQISYSLIYFIKANHEVPYPSIGDVFYFGSIPLYIYGILLLARASGVHIGMRSFINKMQAIIIPAIILTISYMYFLKGYEFDWSAPITIFLDFGYPLGQAIYISMAILTYLLSRKVLGGMMKKGVLYILLSLVLQYAADYFFLYQNSQGTWRAAGINDYMYLIAYFAMTISLLQLNTLLSGMNAEKA